MKRVLANGTENYSALKLIRSKSRLTANGGISLCSGDIVTVTGNAVAILSLIQPSGIEQEIAISDNATVVLIDQQSVVLTLGRLFARIRGYFDVATTPLTLGARGTEFEVKSTSDSTSVSVFDGRIKADSPDPKKGGGVQAWLREHILGSSQRFPIMEDLTIGPLQKLTITAGAQIPITGTVTQEGCAFAIQATATAFAAGKPEYPSTDITPFYLSPEARLKAFTETRTALFCGADAHRARDLESLGDVFADWGDGERALYYYNQSAESNPKAASDGVLISKIANGLRLRGDLDTAEATLKQALETDKSIALTYSGLGDVYVDRARVNLADLDSDEAIAHLKQAVKFYEESLERLLSQSDKSQAYQAITHYHLGEAFLLLAVADGGKEPFDIETSDYFDSSRRNFEMSLKEWPEYLFAQTARQNMYLVQAQSYDDGIGDSQLSPEVHLRFRTTAAELLDKAEQELKSTLKLHERFAFAHLLLGKILEEKGSLWKSIDEYKRAIELDPSFAEPYYKLGALLHERVPSTNRTTVCTILTAYLQAERPIFRSVGPYDSLLSSGHLSTRWRGEEIGSFPAESYCDFSTIKH